jgi:hypothetical protein
MTIEDIRRHLATSSLQTTQKQEKTHVGTLTDHLGTVVDFEILCGKNPSLASQCDLEWAEFYKSLLDYFARLSPEDRLTQAQGVQLNSKHWDWLKKTIRYQGANYYWFFLMAESRVQGVCLIRQPEASKLERGDVFYIEYLASAPWNLANPISPKIFSGIGTQLLQAIILYAANTLGLKYGFNLHALQQAEGFYEGKLNMQHLAQHDKTENGRVLKFYELPAEQTKAFVS